MLKFLKLLPYVSSLILIPYTVKYVNLKKFNNKLFDNTQNFFFKSNKIYCNHTDNSSSNHQNNEDSNKKKVENNERIQRINELLTKLNIPNLYFPQLQKKNGKEIFVFKVPYGNSIQHILSNIAEYKSKNGIQVSYNLYQVGSVVYGLVDFIDLKGNKSRIYMNFIHNQTHNILKNSDELPSIQVELYFDKNILESEEYEILELVLELGLVKKNYKGRNAEMFPFCDEHKIAPMNSLLSMFFGDSLSFGDSPMSRDDFFNTFTDMSDSRSKILFTSRFDGIPKEFIQVNQGNSGYYEPISVKENWTSSNPNINDNNHDQSMNLAMNIKRKLESMGVLVYLPHDTKDAMDWSDLAGYDEAKKAIEDTLLITLDQQTLFNKITEITRGKQGESNRARLILFNGPPGTGKTSTARIISNLVKVPLIYVSLESIVSKWFGESEKNLGKIFDYARELGQIHGGCIIFVDEIDSLAVSRDEINLHEASRRMLSILLRRLDGFDTQKDKTILICATNREKDLDEAFRSRIDITIMFPLPNLIARQLIIKRYAKHLSDIEINELAKHSEGLSGRNIKDFCQISERRWGAEIIKNNTRLKDTTSSGTPDNETIQLSGPPLKYYLKAAKEKIKQQ